MDFSNSTSTIIKKAWHIAASAHEGQFRKYSEPGKSWEQYIAHPKRVAERLFEVGFYDEIIAAALLHDVFEDCDVKFRSEVANELSPRVFLWIHELTNPSKGLRSSRALRKEIDREHISRISYEAANIKLADRADNLNSMEYAPLDFLITYVDESEKLFRSLTSHPYFRDTSGSTSVTVHPLVSQLLCDYSIALEKCRRRVS